MTTKQKLDAWQGLIRGDAVKISGERGQFTFNHAMADATTAEILWIEVHGGLPGRTKLRSFMADRVIVPSDKDLLKQRKQRALKAEEKGQ
jgi:hypothetical protein